ncbi:MAG TPA: sigma-70 family RNA polymerase sigma factor [Planctomycetota bacterium]|nr:sigma-70 family RNA polymerase sigma factor [Planctomycetota bacterium]
MSDVQTDLGGVRKDFPLTTANFQARLRDPDSVARMEVMETLATRYWKPVYHFLRMSYSKSNEDAKDLTQAFFAWLMERDLLLRYDSERSSFRTFLKGILRNFAGNEHQALQRLKRGGGPKAVPVDLAQVGLAAPAVDPDQAFDRSWLKELLDRAIDRVRARYQANRRAVPFLVFQQYDLAPEGETPTYAMLAGRCGIKESDVRNYLHEVREAIRSEMKVEVSATGDGVAFLDELGPLFRS